MSLPGVARDPNIAPLLGVNMEEEPCYVLREFSEQGDLTQFLQNHVAESSGSTLSDIPTLRWLSVTKRFTLALAPEIELHSK